MDQKLQELRRANNRDPEDHYTRVAYERALDNQGIPYFSQNKVYAIEELIDHYNYVNGITLVKHDDSDYKGTNFKAANIRTLEDERFILFNDDHEATSFIWQNRPINFDLRFNKFAVFELPILANETTIVPISLDYIKAYLRADSGLPTQLAQNYAISEEGEGLNFLRLDEGWALFVMTEWGSSEVFETPTEAVWEYSERTERDFDQNDFDFLNLQLVLSANCQGEFEELPGGEFYKFNKEAKTTGHNFFAEDLLGFAPKYACRITKLASDALNNSIYAGSEIPGMTF